MHLKPTNTTPAWPPSSGFGLNASIGLARLDERLAAAPEPVRAGWVSRALIHEAVASLRLNGSYVTANDLTLMSMDSLDRLPDQDLGRAVNIHRMPCALTRRHPRHLFSPQLRRMGEDVVYVYLLVSSKTVTRSCMTT